MSHFSSSVAESIYQDISGLPIVSPHGHCDPAWFAQNQPFKNAADLLITPDHYVFRMLYSQGVSLQELGIGAAEESRDPFAIFKLLVDHWHCFLGTPTRRWLEYTFQHAFGLEMPLNRDSARHYFSTINELLATPEFLPRAILDRENIIALATTDAATDSLEHHQIVTNGDWNGRVIPTFRPDGVLNPAVTDFHSNVELLGQQTDCDTSSYLGYLDALRSRRRFFIEHGATASDHDVPDLNTQWLSQRAIIELFSRALESKLTDKEASAFYGHMLSEMAEMSLDDGLVMQLHVGCYRSTNQWLLEKYGRDVGADIPGSVDWVKGLGPLLNRVGNNKAFTLIVFTLNEADYAHQLAPMAGHWPAMKLGPPWWFHDSARGMVRFFDRVVESAGYWNLAGFNDDTRALLSIPARHDLWRQAVAEHLGEQVSRCVFGYEDAAHVGKQLATDLALRTYKLQ